VSSLCSALRRILRISLVATRVLEEVARNVLVQYGFEVVQLQLKPLTGFALALYDSKISLFGLFTELLLPEQQVKVRHK
jgi:hypothetical protein